ncbi:hypothetical protein Patl1_07238 [Pistacia atlantica]|uniref:Uncharacterized protein n=1 Tax=Pistacia atlantica TaxID=434234 RepID=A0ACC1AGB6_9ROSI|nr:hypothetical protein Patl1_07238 [Pistacia atlantica]
MLHFYSQELRCLITQPELEIVIPGSQVPDWFIYQSKGASIRIFPQVHLNVDICRGLALCAAFSVHPKKGSRPDDKMIELYCVLEIDNSLRKTYSLTLTIDSLAKSDHLWLTYYSRGYLFDKNPQGFHSLSVVSFQYANQDCVTLKVKECGFRPVYNSDVEEFIRASNNPSTSSGILGHNRLAVTSTIIKRSRDYYFSDQQPYPKRLR